MLSYFVVYLFSLVFLLLLSRKWCLPGNKSKAIILISVLLSILSVYSIYKILLHDLIVLSILAFGFSVFYYLMIILYWFYRNPERNIPAESRVIVSPADGKVIYINKINANKIVSVKKGNRILINELENVINKDQELIHIGISMVFTDVHVNRSPINGITKFIKHTDGKFLSLRHEDALSENERQTLIIGNEDLDIILVQIASRLVRRIVGYINEGQTINLGDRIGMIKFGSQVDILLPESKIKELNLNINDILIAGETIIARY